MTKQLDFEMSALVKSMDMYEATKKNSHQRRESFKGKVIKFTDHLCSDIDDKVFTVFKKLHLSSKDQNLAQKENKQ